MLAKQKNKDVNKVDWKEYVKPREDILEEMLKYEDISVLGFYGTRCRDSLFLA